MTVEPSSWTRVRNYLSAEDWIDSYDEDQQKGELTIYIKSLPTSQEWLQTKQIVETIGLRPVMHDPRV